MLKGLRVSNSVCGRIIQKEEISQQDTAEDIMGSDNSPAKSPVQQTDLHQIMKCKRQRRIVKVLNLIESAKSGVEKYIKFTQRLHPWTTIKQLKQIIHQNMGYHVHRQRLFFGNFELLNNQTLDYYGLLCEQSNEIQKINDINDENLDNINSQDNSDQNSLIYQDQQQNENSNFDCKKKQRETKDASNSVTRRYIHRISTHEILKRIQDQSSLSNKIVILKLAPDLQKLSKLNQINMMKCKENIIDDDRINLNHESPVQNNEIKLQKNISLSASKQQERENLDSDIYTNQYIDVFGSIICPQELQIPIREIEKGFKRGLKPKLTEDGTSGTYLLRDSNKKTIAVFKPIDEEAFAPNNPRDHVGPFGSKTFRVGVLSGESCIREVAAFLLDYKGFSGVPPTTLVATSHDSFQSFKFSSFEIVTDCNDYVDMIQSIIAPQNQMFNNQHLNDQNIQLNQTELKKNNTLNENYDKFLKIGSLQQFVKSKGPIENFSCNLFEKDEIHKIAVLDLRILNLDRNDCNILVQQKINRKDFQDIQSISSFDCESILSMDQLKKKESKTQIEYSLVPIDHGLSIPDTLAINSYDLVWLSYPQADMPFSQKTLDYIKNLDIKKDVELLEKTFKFRPQCLRNMRISGTLLKKGAMAGLNLQQIGKLMCRPDYDDEQLSLLEQIVNKARMCSNMMTQMQNKFVDSQMRIILPNSLKQQRKLETRRNSDVLTVPQAYKKKISSIERERLQIKDALIKEQKNNQQNPDLSCHKLRHIQMENNFDYSPMKVKKQKPDLEYYVKYYSDMNKKLTQENFEKKSKNIQIIYEHENEQKYSEKSYKFNQSIQSLEQYHIDQQIIENKQQNEKKVQKESKRDKKIEKKSRNQESENLQKSLNQLNNQNQEISSSFSESESQAIVYESIFKGFEYTAKNLQQCSENIYQINHQEKAKNLISQQQKQILVQKFNFNLNKTDRQPEKFSKAIKKLKKKLGRTSIKRKVSLYKKHDNTASKFVSNLSKIMKQRVDLRRTTSYVEFKISEESDEDSDADIKSNNKFNQKEMQKTKEGQQNVSGIKKIGSTLSIVSMSQTSSASGISKGFLSQKSCMGGQSRQSQGDSKADKLRFIERKNHDIFSQNGNIYKQKMTKMNLERDLKWDGPHDDLFFRCFEQYLDDTISKIIRHQIINQKNISPKLIQIQEHELFEKSACQSACQQQIQNLQIEQVIKKQKTLIIKDDLQSEQILKESNSCFKEPQTQILKEMLEDSSSIKLRKVNNVDVQSCQENQISNQSQMNTQQNNTINQCNLIQKEDLNLSGNNSRGTRSSS